MRMILALMIAGVFLAGCVTTPPATPRPDGPRQCGAQAAQALIGSQVGAVDFAAGANVRIVCTTCAATKDYQSDRLNVRFDASTGVITAVDCG